MTLLTKIEYERENKVISLFMNYCCACMIYVSIKTSVGHWYLMIVYLEEETIYHLDTNCPVVASE